MLVACEYEALFLCDGLVMRTDEIVVVTVVGTGKHMLDLPRETRSKDNSVFA